MTHHVLDMPVTRARRCARCSVGDTVTLETHAVRHPRRHPDRDVRPRPHARVFDLAGHAVVHTAPNVRKVDRRSDEYPSGYEPLCIGTTTSQRMERFTRPLMERDGVRMIVGKGGMGQDTLDAFRELGGAYLAVVGGAAALETTWIEAIEEVDMDDLHPESLWRFRIKGFGPLLVTMDSHGGSLHARVQDNAAARRDAILARIGASE